MTKWNPAAVEPESRQCEETQKVAHGMTHCGPGSSMRRRQWEAYRDP
ncbi:unnamed protein product [Staurois parvus]|uniref:Uncharacterized protein n=1 Tax=Staurois parvus TaxID=386267 RepID=A0ABN9HI89_9NEOB|nr:unnamed protein product [Staurois parvus]